MDSLIECVPNFSEGRDKGKIKRISTAIETSHRDVLLLGVEPDPDYNRTVVTFAGTRQAVLDAAFAGIKQAAKEIDMREHRGEHPRMGASDVVPFIPIANVTMEECVSLARELGKKVGKELNIPIYFYGKAATSPERTLLSSIRKGQYEALEDKLADPDWKPDAGPDTFSPSVARTGATVIGVRDFLIAYNINLKTDDITMAKKIASLVRTSGRKVKDTEGNVTRVPGSLKATQAMGVSLEQQNITQVSMNLLSFRTTGMHHAIEEVRKEAAKLGVKVTGSELIGLVPLEAMRDAGRYYIGKVGKDIGKGSKEWVEADVVREAVKHLGLDDLAPFDPEQKIIDYLIEKKQKEKKKREKRDG